MQQRPSKSRIDEEIDANLKRAFDDISNEAIPDRLASLLDELRAAEGTSPGEERRNER